MYSHIRLNAKNSVGVSFLQASWFSSPSQKTDSMLTDHTRLPLGVNECMNVWEHGVLRYSCIVQYSWDRL